MCEEIFSAFAIPDERGPPADNSKHLISQFRVLNTDGLSSGLPQSATSPNLRNDLKYKKLLVAGRATCALPYNVHVHNGHWGWRGSKAEDAVLTAF